MTTDMALLLSIFWCLSRSALPLAEKITLLEDAAALLRGNIADVELAQLEHWYQENGE